MHRSNGPRAFRLATPDHQLQSSLPAIEERRRSFSGTAFRLGGATALALAALVALSALMPAPALACDACNLAFSDEIRTARRGTPAARDILDAMIQQEGLPLQGLTSPLITAALAADRPVTGTLAPAATPPTPSPEAQASATSPLPEDGDFIEIIRRDEGLPIPPTGYVSQDAVPDKSFTIELDEGRTYIGNNVVYDGFLTNGGIPGPTIVVDEGDIVELVVVNNGTVPHGASIHAAYTQTSKYLGNIAPGETKRVLFRATYPGVFMYHCAPGGHAIPMHVLFGQYGMMVVKPKKTQYQLETILGQKPDAEIYLVQHELYASGKDAIEGNAAYVTFNGKLFRYIEDPISAKPGDYVRIYFLNVGPNLLSTFHIVGIIWDFAYWQGHPEAVFPGGQSVTAGPSDSWVVEFRMPPDEGAFLMLSHAVGATSRGAIGALVGDRNAETPVTVTAEGPLYSPQELDEISASALRVISPFKPGTDDLDRPVVYGPETEEVTIQIIGNSYYPKVVQVAPGTRIRWVNEDVFTYLAGEFSGIHNAVGTSGPERFASPLLAHAESFTRTFTQEGEYDYICTPHPYMKGKILVARDGRGRGLASLPVIGSALLGLALAFVLVVVVARKLRQPAPSLQPRPQSEGTPS